MTALLAAVAGSLFVGGVVLMVWALKPQPPKPEVQRRRGRSLRAWARSISPRTRTLLVAGAIGGVVLAAISGFLVLAVIVPIAAVGVPYLLGKADTREKDTLSALEAWARSLAAASATGRLTLRDVIVVTRTSTPELLRPAVDRMHQRIVTTWSVGDALRAFAEELDSSWADEVSIYLIQAADYSSEGLADALNALADNLASQVKMRAEIYREREKPRRVMVQMVLIVIGTLLLVVLLGRTEQLAPFSTALGQLLLVLVLASMAGLLLWARAIARPAPDPRFLLEHGAER